MSEQSNAATENPNQTTAPHQRILQLKNDDRQTAIKLPEIQIPNTTKNSLTAIKPDTISTNTPTKPPPLMSLKLIPTDMEERPKLAPSEYLGTTYSILRYNNNIYLIALSIQTQGTIIKHLKQTKPKTRQNQISKWLHKIIKENTKGLKYKQYPKDTPYRIFELIENINAYPNEDFIKTQQSPVIKNICGALTQFESTNHNITVMIIKLILDQTSFGSQIFTNTLENLNQAMTQNIVNTITPFTYQYFIGPSTYQHFIEQRRKFAENLVKQTAIPKQIRNITFTPNYNYSKFEPAKRHAHFLTKLENTTHAQILPKLPQTTNQNQQKQLMPPAQFGPQETNTKETPNEPAQNTKWPTLQPFFTYSTIIPLIGLILFAKNTKGVPTRALNNNITITTIYNLQNQMDDKNTQSKPHSGFKNNFVFDWQEHTVINPSIHYYSIKYQGCDIYALMKHLKKTITYHHNLCNQSQISTIEQQHLIAERDEFHILLNRKMNIVQARRTCNSLNAKLIEVRNKTEIHRLDNFMTKYNIEETFSGIYYDPVIHEFLFTNGDYVNGNTSKHAPSLHDGWEKKAITWEEMHKAVTTYYYSVKPIFIYSKAGTTNIITVYSNQHGYYTQTRGYGKQYNAATLFPICSTPKATHTRDIIYKHWQNQCKATLASLETQVNGINERIERLKPSAIPKPTKHIQLFGNYNYVLTKGNQTNSNEDSITNMAKICRSYIKATNTSRQNQPTNGRQKRSLQSLEPYPVTNVIFSAIQLFAKLYNDYTSNHQDTNTNPTNEETQQYIHQLTKTNNYDNDLIQTNSFIATTDTQTRLDLHIKEIMTYVTNALNNLQKFYKSSYKAQPTDFLTQTNYKEIRDKIQSEYNLAIPKQLRKNKIFLSTNNNSYISTIAIPLQPQQHKTDLFRITPIPIWHNNVRYIPNLPYRTFGIPKQGPRSYITTTEEEFAKCIENPYCETSKGTQSAKNPPCGIEQFYNGNKNCIYTRDQEQGHWFHQLENTIYFSLKPNTKVQMHVECSRMNQMASTKKTNLDKHGNYGTITLPFNCQAFIGDNIYRPAIRTLYQDQNDIREDQNITVQSIYPDTDIKIMDEPSPITKQTRIIEAFTNHLISMIIMILILILLISIVYRTLRRKLKETTETADINKTEDNTDTDSFITLPIQDINHAHEGGETYRPYKHMQTYHTTGQINQTRLETIKEEPTYPIPNNHNYRRYTYRTQRPQFQTSPIIMDKLKDNNEPTYQTLRELQASSSI